MDTESREGEKEMTDCEHDCIDDDVIIGYFRHHGIERKGMYCNICNELLDYYPQYNEDDFE